MSRDDLAVIGAIALFAAVAGLAYVIGLPWSRRWQQRLGITQMAIVGLPFVVLGALARTPELGVLSDQLVLRDLGPLLGIALAAVGFRIGLGVDVAQLVATPRTIGALAGVRAVVGWVVIGGAAGACLWATGLHDDPGAAVRDAILLALVGTVTSGSAGRGVGGVQGTDDARLAGRVAGIEELAGVLGLLVLAAVIRPVGAGADRLPPEIWVLVAIGLGGVVGVLLHALARDPGARHGDGTVLALGAVALTAGAASYFRLSPLAVAVFAGIVVRHLAGPDGEELARVADRPHRAIHAFLLFVVGALCVPADVEALALVAVFVAGRGAARWLGTWLGLRVAGVAIGAETRRRLVISPLGTLSIAMVISAHVTYPEAQLAAIALAVVTATIVAELAVHARPASPPTAAAREAS